MVPYAALANEPRCGVRSLMGGIFHGNVCVFALSGGASPLGPVFLCDSYIRRSDVACGGDRMDLPLMVIGARGPPLFGFGACRQRDVCGDAP
jgi:hypothetical protein